ncbi:hypothetical protein CC2G_013358 [Coprinopsis cinerea AmutBmut pab1-1]|nr:hypothetical protein CC2G_013358 [Coprinopsis cinerea AmutBmut pab1-1]
MTKSKGKKNRATRSRKEGKSGGDKAIGETQSTGVLPPRVLLGNVLTTHGHAHAETTTRTMAETPADPSQIFDKAVLAREYDIGGGVAISDTIARPSENVDTVVLGGEYEVGSTPPNLTQTGDTPAERSANVDTAALGEEYEVGSTPPKLTQTGDTALLAAEYAIGSSPHRGNSADTTRASPANASEYDTANLAADYDVGTASAALSGEKPDALDHDTEHLGMEYFIDPDSATIPKPSRGQKDMEEQDTDDFVEPSVASSDAEMDGGAHSDVTLVSIRTRCRESLLDCYLQEKLAVQNLLDCRRRIMDHIALLTRELESMEVEQ